MTPEDDPRSTAVLVSVALAGLSNVEDDEEGWSAIHALRRRGTPEVVDSAVALSRSSQAPSRALAAHLLGQLGAEPRDELRERCCADTLLSMLERESDDAVLAAIATEMGQIADERVPSAVAHLARHANAEVRIGAVHALSRHNSPLAVSLLTELSRDVDEAVRDWATFGLGSLLEDVDTPELREALMARLAEENLELQGEALLGLAVRGDVRVVEPLREALCAPVVNVLAVEAAATLRHPSLLPLLIALQSRTGESDAYFERSLSDAIARLTSERTD